jgi:hypothetical protein
MFAISNDVDDDDEKDEELPRHHQSLIFFYSSFSLDISNHLTGFYDIYINHR